jgi:hypothetical protein
MNAVDQTLTSTAPACRQIHTVDCSTLASAGATSMASNTNIPGSYSDYVYASVTMEWFPKIGPTHALAGTQVLGCYIDNPEQIAIAFTESVNSNFARVRSTRNMFFCNAWERKLFTIPLTRRIKSFNVNATTSYADTDIINRSVQGAVLTVVNNSINPVTDTVVGNWVTTYKLELRGLTNGGT